LEYANGLIEDFLANEECGCAKGSYPHPCPRCIVTIEEARKYIATCTVPDQPQATSAGALSTLVEKWRAHRSGFVYTDATYRNCAEELEAALAVGLSAKQMPYSGSLREAIGTCAYQLEQFVRAAILTPGQKERL